MPAAITKDIWVKRSRKVHGDRYDYSRAEYKGMWTPVCIVCPIHGEFWQRPDSHQYCGYGCSKCGQIQKARKKTLTTKEFIVRARKVHPRNRYSYDEVKYVKSLVPVVIHCNKCNNEFRQIPNVHLTGSGCPKCRFPSRRK